MQLTLVKNDVISKLALPEKCTGRYWISYRDESGCSVDLVSVEGLKGSWWLKSNPRVTLLDSESAPAKELALEPNRFYQARVLADDETVMIRSEPSTIDRRRFEKRILPKTGSITIGRAEGADIRFESRFVSSRHAEVTIGDGVLKIQDLDSSNGTFVNDQRIKSAVLQPGDTISILGLTIVVGQGFIALNNPDGLVDLNQAALEPLHQQVLAPGSDEPVEESNPGTTFFRSPRFARRITTAAFKIDAPPKPDPGDQTPLMMTIGPAITMGLASVFMGAFSVMNVLSQPGGKISQAMPTVVMSLTMMTGMVLWPVLSRRFEKGRRERKEGERREKYAQYLDSVAADIEAERQDQRTILYENSITAQECVTRISDLSRNLWERTIAHDDFASVRLGVGEWPFDVDIRHAERTFSVEVDDVQEQMFALAGQADRLAQVPVSLSLVRRPVVGVIGERDATRALLDQLLVQLVALHSYDELKLVFLMGERDADLWDFARTLPHAWSDDHSFRLVARTAAEARELSAHLELEFARRQMLTSPEEIAEAAPRYVVVALDKRIAGKCEVVGKILRDKTNRGFSVIHMYDELRLLPKECRAVVEVRGADSRVYDRDDIAGDSLSFAVEDCPDLDLADVSRQLSNVFLDARSRAADLPQMLTFLELFDAGQTEHLNALTRWRESNPMVSLAAPIGIDTSGEAFSLDIHEKIHGPHGLVAGMTGSGKSELIMTYILSLAVNYHPNEVAFVLIDYKGGGMANAFAELPHVVGTITNLDGSAVNRALVSIQSELKRRQAIFNAATEQTGVSNIDIYRYQSLFREGLVKEPLPHLLVISDEFAELKSQQPEFMTQLVSAARIGRSLGVHLILATQKPSGVVDDQIWSNSRFRVCLKVQEAADSMEVIKRADAASLTATGRFYVQVGFDEVFEMGQSAWAGAPYYPVDRVERAYDCSATLVSTVGRPVRTSKIDKRKALAKNPPKQLDEITDYLARLAKEEKIAGRPLWLEPIPGRIALHDILKRHRYAGAKPFALAPVVGEFDDPANQRQDLVTVPLSRDGNLIVYGSAGSGKTTFLTTLVYSLISEHSPDELRVYLLDLASETLRAFKDAPHVGDVIFANEAEKVHNLFAMLSDEIARRRRLFADAGGDYASYIGQGDQKLPAILVGIHNYAAFTELFEDEESVVALLTREGSKYGIYFVLTAATVSSVRYRTQQNFRQMFVLQMNDPTEYAGILGRTDGALPSPIPGRGLFRGDAVYEFQTAAVVPEGASESAFIREFCGQLRSDWSGSRAPHVPVLPDEVTVDSFDEEVLAGPLGTVPVGIDKKTLEPITYDFTRQFVNVVLSRDSEDRRFVRAICDILGHQYGDGCILLDSADRVAGSSTVGGATIASGEDACRAEVARLFEEMLRRNNAAADARAAGAIPAAEEPLMVVIPSFSHLLGAVGPEAREKLTAVIGKCDQTLGANLVVCDTAAALNAVMYEPWARDKMGGSRGLWIGDGITDQYVLQAAGSSDLYQPIGGEFGYVVNDNKTILIKMIQAGVSGGGL